MEKDTLRLRSLNNQDFGYRLEHMIDLSRYGGHGIMKKVRLSVNATITELQINYKYVELFTSSRSKWVVHARVSSYKWAQRWIDFETYCPVCKDKVRFIFQIAKVGVCLNGHRVPFNELIVKRTRRFLF